MHDPEQAEEQALQELVVDVRLVEDQVSLAREHTEHVHKETLLVLGGGDVGDLVENDSVQAALDVEEGEELRHASALLDQPEQEVVDGLGGAQEAMLPHLTGCWTDTCRTICTNEK